MLEAALENGIIQGARDGAQKFIALFLSELGFTEIEFSQFQLPLTTPQIPELPKGFVTTPQPRQLVTPAP